MRNETCAECGRVLLEEEATEFEGRVYCPECLDSLTTFCRYCGDRIFRDDNEGASDTPLCYPQYFDLSTPIFHFCATFQKKISPIGKISFYFTSFPNAILPITEIALVVSVFR